ncbi:MAG: TonB-dependent receptor plug domain-containing protein [Alphaproteobacteria bacterium]|nr:TonB-dependent receptor plug domain-containing protein [Alphaproteobacteria bacterium]
MASAITAARARRTGIAAFIATTGASGARLRSRTLQSVGLTALAAALASPVLLPADAAAQAPDEIVVKAQRRELTLQDLPVSGTVIGEEDILDFGGFTDDTELGQFLTGVEVEDVGNTEYFIRGANSNATTPFARSAVTQLLNGAEVAGGFAGRSFERMDNFDVQQVAVFRGTQGALYGRGAIGGVINQISNKPKNRLEYRATSSWNVTHDEGRFDGVFNAPIVKNRLLFRGGVAYQEGDGYIRNDFRDESVNGLEFFGGRTGFRYFFSDKVDATLMVDYGEASVDRVLHSSIAATLPGSRFNVFDDPVDVNGNPFPSDTLANNVTVANPLAVGFPGPNPGDPFHQAFDTETFYEENTFTGNLTVNFELPFGVGTSITGVRSRAYEVLLDDDYSYIGGVNRLQPANCSYFQPGTSTLTGINGPLILTGVQTGTLSITSPTMGMIVGAAPVNPADFANDGMCETSRLADTSIVTQEFRLQSPQTGRFTWLIGTDGRVAYQPQTFITRNRNPAVTTVTAANAALSSYWANVQIPIRDFREDSDLLESHIALFGNVGYNILDWLHAGFSTRYTYERIHSEAVIIDQDLFRGYVAPGGAGGITGQGAGGTLLVNPNYGSVALQRSDDAVYQSVIPSFTLTARAPGDWIYFASWGQGFKPGGFNDIGGTGGGGADRPRQYNEEWANSYELGLKKTFLTDDGNLRVSLIAFRTEYNDRLQSLNVTEGADDNDVGTIGTDLDPQDTFSTLLIYNVGDGYAQGVELDIGGLVRNPLNLGGAFNYSAGATWGESRNTSGSLENQQFSGFSTWSARGNFTYRRALPFAENTGIGLFLNSNFSWSDDTDGCETFRTLTNLTGCSRGADADIRAIWNLRGGIEGENYGHGWQLTAFWDNWNDRSYERSRPQIGGIDAYAEVEPSNWGLRLTVTGGER